MITLWFAVCLVLWLAVYRHQWRSWNRRKQDMIPVNAVPLWWWFLADVQVEYPPSLLGAGVIPAFVFIVGYMIAG